MIIVPIATCVPINPLEAFKNMFFLKILFVKKYENI